MQTWMKQRGDLFGFGIKAGQVRAFVQITIDAGQRQVFDVVAPAMTPRNDVLNVQRRQW